MGSFNKNIKVALVYDRVNKWGGAECVLLALREIFPDAPLYTSVYDSKSAPWAKVFSKVLPSFLQKIPFAKTNHEFLGAFTPIAFESMDFSQYDLVISVTSEAAKGIITKPGTLHICYCLTPTRYLWSGRDFYFKNPPSMLRKIPLFWYVSRPLVSYLIKWDKIAADRPDVMVAISQEVKKRIQRYYQREAEVIYPPVDIRRYTTLAKKSNKAKRKYFLVVNRLIPYKKVDLVVEAFNRLKLPLVVVGIGSEEKRLKRMARKNITFAGFVDEDKLADYYQGAKALIMPQEEDFGIVAIEAQAMGIPVIAYDKGGVIDTVVEKKTGILFSKQEVDSLTLAVSQFNNIKFKRSDLLKNSKRFSKENFKVGFLNLLKRNWVLLYKSL